MRRQDPPSSGLQTTPAHPVASKYRWRHRTGRRRPGSNIHWALGLDARADWNWRLRRIRKGRSWHRDNKDGPLRPARMVHVEATSRSTWQASPRSMRMQHRLRPATPRRELKECALLCKVLDI